MRALFLLFALVFTGTLHAAELDAVDHQEGRCESRKAEEAVHGGEAAVAPDAVPAASGPRGASDGIGGRNRMSPRWHSLLPGMFR